MYHLLETSVTTGRWDLYGPVHKGLRLGHARLMERLGRADFTGDINELLADLNAHLDVALAHLTDEETVIHAAWDRRHPGAAAGVQDQHQHHRQSVAELRLRVAALQADATPAAGRALYIAFSRFVAEDLAHMAEEETTVWPRLCELFSDDELLDLEMAIIASLSPEANMAFMKLMMPAISRAERLAILSGMKAQAPPEAYRRLVEQALRPLLPSSDLLDLDAAGLLVA